MPLMTRRAFAAGTAALATVPATPALAGSATRNFRVMCGTQPIGTHTVTVQRGAGGTTASSNIDIVVKGLGIITLYRYALSLNETYDPGGMLMSMSGRCNDDGEDHFVNVTRQGGALAVSGSSYTGPVQGGAAAASYWRRDALNASPWISSQSGQLFAVSASPISSAEAPAGASAYRVTNGSDYTIDLFYDARGEWVGSAFDAKGERATIEYVSETGALQG